MPIVHYLNVLEGDCSIIQHANGNVTVIDVNNAKKKEPLSKAASLIATLNEQEINKSESSGNFRQKEKPVNPIEYMNDRAINNVFRFFLTHPDMDHMGGIKEFFEEFSPTNFWDTDNDKEMESFQGSPHSEDDWKFYKNIRDTKPNSSPRRLTGYSGDKRQYINKNESDSDGGDGIHILTPTPELLKTAKDTGDYHISSYVILYYSPAGKILFSGDSHDESWKHILDKHKSFVSNIDLLIAPHHGRHSDRSFEFLDVLKPKMTFFGNAKSQHLAYSAWNSRNLPYITNNQANCMIVDVNEKPMKIFVTNETFAKKINKSTVYNDYYKGWFLAEIL